MLARGVVNPKVRTVDTDLLGRDSELDGLKQCIRAGARARALDVLPVAKGEESDARHAVCNRMDVTPIPGLPTKRETP